MRIPLAILIAFFAMISIAADFKNVDPNVFPKDDPRAKDLSRMMWKDATRRMQEANLRESKAFTAVTTKEEWEKYRDVRIQKLKESLGTFPEVPKDMKIKVTRTLDGDGFVIQCILYETRPSLWVSANLYLPKTIPDKMPGILISHSHHTPKTHGELQDMGMTWARSGVAVLVPDHIGYGERRQHDFHTEKDYDKPFRVSRQDYYFRYNSNLQLSAAGESLMGWMVWDLMRGVDVLLKQTHIDKDRIILLGAVAGGGDPAGVTAALDQRIACVAPFNFGGWQPESSVSDNPDRDTPWFGEGYWESTRGLKNGARDGFAHFVIVGSVAPRPLIYAHEFAWDAKKDPAWPRLQKIYGFYNATDKIHVVHGRGSVKGKAGSDNTHCDHIGAAHRKGIYPALKNWFGMPIPEEYSKRRPTRDLLCWTEEAKKELKPKKLHEVAGELAHERAAVWVKLWKELDKQFLVLPTQSDYTLNSSKLYAAADKAIKVAEQLEKEWVASLGDIEPRMKPAVIEGKVEEVPGGTLSRFAIEVEQGIVVPLVLISPKGVEGRRPVVVMVAQRGKAGFLKERSDAIATFLKAGVVVCLPDVRGTGETQPGSSADRGSTRTSVSQTNLILGQTVLGSQLCDLRTVIRWLLTHDGINGERFAVWGDSFAKTNPKDARFAIPLDAESHLVISEPNGGPLAGFAGAFEHVPVVYIRGELDPSSLFASPYVYYPHDAIVPGVAARGGWFGKSRSLRIEATVDALNRQTGVSPVSPTDAAKWVIDNLNKK